GDGRRTRKGRHPDGRLQSNRWLANHRARRGAGRRVTMTGATSGGGSAGKPMMWMVAISAGILLSWLAIFPLLDVSTVSRLGVGLPGGPRIYLPIQIVAHPFLHATPRHLLLSAACFALFAAPV